MPVNLLTTKDAPDVRDESGLFRASSLLFGVGLAFVTFEDIRPYGVMASDYFFSFSLLLLICSNERRSLKARGSGVLAAGALILCGAALSVASASSASAAVASFFRVFMLFGLFAPLALVHSRNLRRNMQFLLTGISANCIVAMLSAWISPDFVNTLAVNPQVATDLSDDIGRYAGLSGNANILGLSAAVAVLVAIGLLLSGKGFFVRCGLALQIFICTVGGLLTGSRTFFVSLIPALAILTLWRRLNGRLFLRLAGALVLIVILWSGINYFTPDLLADYTERFSATAADDSANEGRLLTAGLALLEISQKPALGWGVDRFGEAGLMFLPLDNDFIPAHVVFLHYWYAAGVLGGAGFLALFFLPVRRMLMMLKEHPPDDLAAALRLGVSVYLLLFIASNLHPLLLNRFLYMPLFVFAGLATMVPNPGYFSRLAHRNIMPMAQPSIGATS
jgi:O-antigen ligase